MSAGVLRVAVVGHTNTGKTSLLRTLTRDVAFGEVSDRPATTRHVEGAAMLAGGRTVLELYDTPGLEDSIGLLELLEKSTGRRADGLDAIRAFLEGRAARKRFAQEAKALRQVLESDIALYVVDARDRVLAKHRDELEILARTAVPVVPVLNFTAAPDAQVAMWREHLSRVNMHAVAEFDTVVLDGVSEQRLYEKMRTLLGAAEEKLIDELIAERRRQRDALIRGSADLVADLLIDVAALVVPVPVADVQEGATTAGGERTLEALRDRIRAREVACVEQLLELHRFRPGDVESDGLITIDGRWGLDLFSPEAMREFGLKAGGAVAAGAAVGFVFDTMTAGMSMGAGTATGAAIGGLLGGGKLYGKRLLRRATGTTELRCDNATLRLLGLRQIALVQALLRRGHAAMVPMKRPVSSKVADVLGGTGLGRLPTPLEQARTKPRWSTLDPEHDGTGTPIDPARRAARETLAKELATRIEG